jgi:radical SAM superfamily enzyme YgiQ (UPF0313 family)
MDEAGFRPVIVDFNFSHSPRKDIQEILRRDRPVLCCLTLRNFDSAFMTESPIFFPLGTRRLIRDIRRWGGPPAVVGGVAYSASPEDLLNYLEADYGVAGSDETAAVELARQMATGKQDPEAIPSLVWRDAGRVRTNPPRDTRGPLPAIRRTFFDHSRYYRPGLGNHYSWGSVETQRGCNRGCIYCIEPEARGRSLRRKPPEAVIAEIEDLASQGIDWMWFTDSEFNLNLRECKDLCRALQKRFQGKISWGAYFVPRPFDAELAGLLSASGCVAAGFDVGHADNRMLRRVGKDFDFGAIERTAGLLRSTSIHTKYSVLFGAPGETEKSVATALRRLARLGGIVEIGAALRLYPGTPSETIAERFRPLEKHPALFGKVANNDTLLEPIYYVSPRILPRYPAFLEELTAGEGRFLLPRLYPLPGERYGDWRGIRPGYSRRRSNDLLLASEGTRRDHADAGYIDEE